MKFLLIRNTPTETPGLVGEQLRAAGMDCTDVCATDSAGLPDDAGFDGLCVFGSPESCTRISELPPLMAVGDVMKRFVYSNRPVLGICFGGQLLATVLGARVARIPRPEIGAMSISLTPAGRISPFFAGFPAEFPVAQWHSDSFEIPPGAEWLAKSPDCAHQAFSWRRCLGLQFHPEITRARAREWLVEYAAELENTAECSAQLAAEFERTHAVREQLCERLVQNCLRRWAA